MTPKHVNRLRLMDLSVTPDMDEKTRLVRELMTLGRERVLHDHDTNVPEDDRSSFLHPNVYPRAKEIGQRLHEITQESDPSFFSRLFDTQLRVFSSSDQKELEWTWNGIGGWLA